MSPYDPRSRAWERSPDRFVRDAISSRAIHNRNEAQKIGAWLAPPEYGIIVILQS